MVMLHAWSGNKTPPGVLLAALLLPVPSWLLIWVFLTDWISHIRFQGCTDWQSMIKRLCHEDTVSAHTDVHTAGGHIDGDRW